jgi:hypothetical protein
MSRKGIEFGSITHHPDGIPHGPHPGRAEASIGAKYTDELAVMMDSFRPLKVQSRRWNSRTSRTTSRGSTRSTSSSRLRLVDRTLWGSDHEAHEGTKSIAR